MRTAFEILDAALTSPSAGWRAAVMLVLGGHIAWSCGLLPGISGFALADEVEQVQSEVAQLKTEVAELRSELLEEKIFEQRLRHCSSSGNARQLHLERLQRLLVSYRQVTGGHSYQLPSCADVL